MRSRKQLIVNADDFGFTPDVNEGIVEAYERGILTATTLMANGAAFEDAVRLAQMHPGLDVGCHLVLVGGRSVLPPHKPLPGSVAELLAAIACRQIPFREELRAQMRKIIGAGIHPSHLDTHKHTHLAPPVLEAVAEISREFDVRWVRRPFDLPITATAIPWFKRVASSRLRFVEKRFSKTLERYGCRTTDYFAGFQLTGRYRTTELVQLIAQLPEGVTEFMCHPGRCRDALRTAATRLTVSREHELAALTAPETFQALEECGVELVSYKSLTVRSQ